MFPGNRTHNLLRCWRNALPLSHRNTYIYLRCELKWGFYGGQESSMHCNFRKHMQIEKAPANQENIFNKTAGAANAHNTTNERIVFAVRFFFWFCSEHLQRMRCKIDKVVFLICRCFFSICSVLSSLSHRRFMLKTRKTYGVRNI